jgi:hypothetical protein
MVGGAAGAPQRHCLYPTAEVGNTTDDLDHAAVSTPNGMEFDVPIEGHALKVCLKPDKACPLAVGRRALLPAWLPLSASSAEDCPRLNESRRPAGLLHSQGKPVLGISRHLCHGAVLLSHHSRAFRMLPEDMVQNPTAHAPSGRGKLVPRFAPSGAQGKTINTRRMMRLY